MANQKKKRNKFYAILFRIHLLSFRTKLASDPVTSFHYYFDFDVRSCFELVSYSRIYLHRTVAVSSVRNQSIHSRNNWQTNNHSVMTNDFFTFSFAFFFENPKNVANKLSTEISLYLYDSRTAPQIH